MEKFEDLRLLIAGAIQEHGGDAEYGKRGLHGAELIVKYRDTQFVVTVSEAD